MPANPPYGQLGQISAAIGALQAHVEMIREASVRQERQTAEVLARLGDMSDRVSLVEETKKTVDGMAPTIARIENLEQRVIGAAALATVVGGIIMAVVFKFNETVAWVRKAFA